MCKGEQQVGEEETAPGGVEGWMNGQDPGIKLFGRMISAPNGSENEEGGDMTSSDNDEQSLNPLTDFDHSFEEALGHLDEDRAFAWGADELGSSSGSNSGCEGEKPSKLDLSPGSPANPSTGLRPPQALSETEDLQLPSTKSCEGEVTARKPEKAAPCPRCDSLDTKFCYFNNYNVNQPRHFCKHCQRYWTAGGTLRNVPVGAGRRKSKHSSVAQQQQIQQQQQQQQQQHQQQLLPFDCFAVRRSEADAAQQIVPQSFRPILPMEKPLLSSSPALSSISTLTQPNLQPPGSSRASAFTSKAAGATSNIAAAAAGSETTLANAIPKLQCFSTISSDVSSDAQVKSTEAHSKCSEAASSAFSATYRKPEPQPQPQLEGTAACGVQQAGAADAATGGWVSAAAPAPFCFLNGPWPPYVFNPGWSGLPQSHVASPLFHPAAAAAAAAALPPQMFSFPWCHPSMWVSWSAPPVTWAAWEAGSASAATIPGSSLGKHPRAGRIEGPLWLPKTLRMDRQGEQVRSSILASLGLTDAQPNTEAFPVSKAD